MISFNQSLQTLQDCTHHYNLQFRKICEFTNLTDRAKRSTWGFGGANKTERIKPDKMKTIESIQSKIDVLKTEIKIAKKMTLICEAYKRKEDFTYLTRSGLKEDLFRHKLWRYGGLGVRNYDLEHFEKMYKLCFHKPFTRSNFKNVKHSIRFINAQIKLDNNNYWSICASIYKEQFDNVF